MFKKILIPVDLTDRHAATLDLVARLAAGAEVVVLHVIEVIHGLPRDEDPAFYRRLEEKANRHVALESDRLRTKNVTAHGVVRFGDRVNEIVSFAAREKIDLIAISSHRVDPARPGDGWGTLSFRVGHLAPCPVLL